MDFQNNPQGQAPDQLPDQTGNTPAGNAPENTQNSIPGSFQNNLQNSMNGYFPNGFPGQHPANLPIYVQPAGQTDNMMAKAAMITGIISAVSLVFILLFPFTPFVLGSVSIVLAMLSRGSGKRLSPHAKTGLITSACSIGAVFLVIILISVLLFTSETFIEEFNRTYEDYYGESFDDFYEYYN